MKRNAPDRLRMLMLAVLLAAAPAANAAETVLLPAGSVWKYEDSGVALPSDWKDSGYDDSGWASGPALLGYGEGTIVTPVSFGPDASNKPITTYFRTTFDAGDLAGIRVMLLRANFDDGFVAYLNGTEILRASMPAGPVGFDTPASLHESGSFEEFDVTAALGDVLPTGNVLAVELHQANSTSSDLAIDVELVASDQAAVVSRGPYLQMARPDAMTVVWRTNQATDARVEWGTSPGNLSSSSTDASFGTEHVVTITGLAPGTEYFYSVGTTSETLAGADAEHRFRTPPLPGSTDFVRAWILGDSGQPGQGQEDVRDAYLALPEADATDLLLMLGDNAYNTGTDTEYQVGMFDPYESVLRRIPVWPTRGNHDAVRAGADNDYYDFFHLPTSGEAGGVPSGSEAYYSFDHGNVHFVCLDSDGSDRDPDGAMIRWLRQDLAMNTAAWTVAFWHHPPYSKGSHDSDNPADSGGRLRDMRENALPVADSLGVDLVLCGHSHSYERSFLLNGHYDVSTTLTPAMILDGGDGREAGDGPYEKATSGSAPGEGTVYVVAGSSSKRSGGALNHPAMFVSEDRRGSVILEVDGGRMDVAFLDDQGVERDRFTLLKPLATPEPEPKPGVPLALAAGPNPFVRETTVQWSVPRAGPARLRVLDVTGRVVRTLADGETEAGVQRADWDGRDDAGAPVGAGVYFVTLEHGGSLRAQKVVRTR